VITVPTTKHNPHMHQRLVLHQARLDTDCSTISRALLYLVNGWYSLPRNESFKPSTARRISDELISTTPNVSASLQARSLVLAVLRYHNPTSRLSLCGTAIPKPTIGGSSRLDFKHSSRSVCMVAKRILYSQHIEPCISQPIKRCIEGGGVSAII
jgi:hypothetical protein